MRLLVGHKQAVNGYSEEVQSLAEANSEVIEKQFSATICFSILRWLDQCLASQ